jgi:hypothetical protein
MQILNGEIKEMDSSLDISANYFVSLNLVYKIIDLYSEKQAKRLSDKDWGRLVNNFILFLDHNFSNCQDELSVMAIRTITKANVTVKFADAPAFRDFVKKYEQLVRAARSLG